MTPEPMRVISSATDPEAAAAAAAALLTDEQSDKGVMTVPFIDPPPDTSVTLPGGGLMDSDGSLHDEAVVRELTGADEEKLSKADAIKNMARYLMTLLRCGVERIGKYENPSESLLGELLVGDREMLVLAIRRATYGDEMKLTLICPACAAAVEAVYDLATEIPIHKLEDPTQRRIEVKLRRGQTAVVQLPTAFDQDKYLSASGKTMSEMNSILLAQCLISIDGMPASGLSAVRGLGIKDRRKLVEVMSESAPGPKYGEVNVECPGCGDEFPLQVGIMELFRG